MAAPLACTRLAAASPRQPAEELLAAPHTVVPTRIAPDLSTATLRAYINSSAIKMRRTFRSPSSEAACPQRRRLFLRTAKRRSMDCRAEWPARDLAAPPRRRDDDRCGPLRSRPRRTTGGGFGASSFFTPEPPSRGVSGSGFAADGPSSPPARATGRAQTPVGGTAALRWNAQACSLRLTLQDGGSLYAGRLIGHWTPPHLSPPRVPQRAWLCLDRAREGRHRSVGARLK